VVDRHLEVAAEFLLQPAEHPARVLSGERSGVGGYISQRRDRFRNRKLHEPVLRIFPGSPDFYTNFDSFTTAKLHAEFCAWAALEPRAANQAFNVVNGDVESWQNLWPRVAEYFGTKVKSDQFKSAYGGGMASSLSKYLGGDASSTMDMAPQPPISVSAAELGLEGTPVLQPNKVEQHIDLVKWSQRSDVKQAWEKIAEREGLDKESFDKATWAFLGFVLGRKFDLVISMSKAREAGWTGYRDTWHSLEGVFDEMRKAGVLPKA
jgi:hypothetical protein